MATQTRGQSISIEDADINIGFSHVESKDDVGGQKILRILAKNVQSIYSDVREVYQRLGARPNKKFGKQKEDISSWARDGMQDIKELPS